LRMGWFRTDMMLSPEEIERLRQTQARIERARAAAIAKCSQPVESDSLHAVRVFLDERHVA
jgi:hypothetical protein